jgi:hypothetical protein
MSVEPVHRRDLDKEWPAIGIHGVRFVGYVLNLRWRKRLVPELVGRASNKFASIIAVESTHGPR